MEIEREAMIKLVKNSLGNLKPLRETWREPSRTTEKWLPTKNVLRRKDT
jgi:hypothetical protein